MEIPSLVRAGSRWVQWLVRGAQGLGAGRRPDFFLLPLLLLNAVLIRLQRLQLIENDGDALRNWEFARQLRFGDIPEDWWHNMPRFGIHALTVASQAIFGTEPIYYYLVPVSMAVGQVALIYAIGCRLSGRLVGVVAALGLTYFPQMDRASSQLLPGVFSGFYIALAVYLWLVYDRAEGRKRQLWLVVATTLVLFVAYLTKITNLFFVPGFALAIWLSHRSRRDVLVLCGGLFALYLGETALYAIFTQHSLGRLEIISDNYGHTGKLRRIEFWDLFARYQRMSDSWKLLFYGGAGAALGVLAFGKERQPKLLLAMCASFLFGLTFYVKDVSPLVQGTLDHQRYFTECAPLMISIATVFLAVVLRQLLQKAASARGRRVAEWLERNPLLVATVLALLMLTRTASAARPPWYSRGLQRTEGRYRVLNCAYRKGIPVLAAKTQVRALEQVRRMFLAEDLMRNGDLLEPPELRSFRYRGKTYYFVANQQVSVEAASRAFRSSRGYIRASRRKVRGGAHVTLLRAEKLTACGYRERKPTRKRPGRRMSSRRRGRQALGR